MRPTRKGARSLMAIVLGGAPLLAGAGEAVAQGGDRVSRYVTTAEPVVALTHATVLDGTGSPARRDQTIVIRDGRIAAVGDASSVQVPQGARVIDAAGHTVIPGMVGLHDHLYYTAAGGRSAQLGFTAPRLYLGSGVTTVRTTGSRNAYAEINLRHEIEAGREVGPRIHITAPYITGGAGATSMTLLNSPEEARRFVSYWAAEGATWLKAYTNIRRAELGAAIEEAHRQGIKVTGHICSVSFTEAVDLGIDNIEHGLLTNTDYDPDKVPDECSPNAVVRSGSVDPASPEVQATFRKMIENDVPMTSTLAVYELFVPGRPTKDARSLEAMAPEVRESYLAARRQIDESGQGISLQAFRNAMAYERAFVEAGGLLAAGVDPTGNGGALPGYGDQRNYELLREAGFTPEETVRIVSANGAAVLGLGDDLGTVEAGKLADLVLLRGDLTGSDGVIRDVVTVFKGGVGFASARLLEDVKGLVGIR